MPRFSVTPGRLVLLLLLLLAGFAGGYFLWPLHVPPLPEEVVRIEISSIRLQPYEIEQETYTFSPDSDQWAQLEELLSQVTIHRCFQTLSGSTATGDTGGRVLNFYGRDGENNILWEITVTAGRHLRMGDRMYHLGWWDNLAGQELAEALAQRLEGA